MQSHITQSDWTPDKVQSLWNVKTSKNIWTIGTEYCIGDQVTYASSTYECIQSHTAQAGWTPPVVPALWGPVSVKFDKSKKL